jgi:hypothetical protein
MMEILVTLALVFILPVIARVLKAILRVTIMWFARKIAASRAKSSAYQPSIETQKCVEEMTDDNFTVYCPSDLVWACIVTAFFFAIITVALLILAPRFENLPMLVAIIPFAITVLYTYMAAYHGSFETRVAGEELSHKELFHARYTFTFDDITRSNRKGTGRFPRLALYQRDEILLIAESEYIGYAFLVKRLQQKGILPNR